MQAIHILDFALNLCGEIVDYKSLRLKRVFWAAGDFELVLACGHPMASRLERDRILCPVGQAHKAMLIEQITKTEKTVSVKGCTLSGLLKRRVCVPPAGSDKSFGYDRIISDAESVMRHYVQNNVITPESADRKMDCMALEEENRRRGKKDVPWSARFEQLDELLEAVGTYCDAGFSIVPDFKKKKLVFTYLSGRDRTGAGGRVTFGMHMGNVSGTEYTENAQQERNAAIVGGAGEDENRMILSICPGGETGTARREVFVDAGSRAAAQELKEEGERRLAERTLVQAIKADVCQTPNCRYGRQWELGDLVTVVSGGRMMNARITQVQESYEEGRPERIEVTFGKPVNGIRQALRQRQGSVR